MPEEKKILKMAKWTLLFLIMSLWSLGCFSLGVWQGELLWHIALASVVVVLIIAVAFWDFKKTTRRPEKEKPSQEHPLIFLEWLGSRWGWLLTLLIGLSAGAMLTVGAWASIGQAQWQERVFGHLGAALIAVLSVYLLGSVGKLRYASNLRYR